MDDSGELPQTASQADVFLSSVQDGWNDEGIRDQFRDTAQLAFSRLANANSPGAESESFTLLLLALLTRHVFRPFASSTEMVAVLAQVAPAHAAKGQTQTPTPAPTPTPRSEASRDVTPSAASVEEELSALFNSTLLDAVWVVDAEIDSRKDMVSAGVMQSVFDENPLDVPASVDEEAIQARGRLANAVRECIAANILDARKAGERLELPLLHAVGLVTDQKDFNRKTIRMNTARLYKQQKFNLLREENEGYSGLINELILGMGPPIVATHDEESGQLRAMEQESAHERNSRARRVMNNTSALIGFFDLDPNRVLDLLLDVFSANVFRHWPFFLALLSASPWGQARSTVEKSSSEVHMDVDMDDGIAGRDGGDDRFGSVLLDIQNDTGKHTCAQLLGFKFTFYQQPGNKLRGSLDDLYLMAAILIREGHVRFADLYPHLTPDEAGMTKLHEDYKTALSDKAMSAKGNALSMAAPLTEDDAEGGALKSARERGKKESDGEDIPPPNQIVGLLKALLAIGQFKHALLILARYPWLCGAFPEVSDLYSRLLNVIIEPAYAVVALSTQVEACASAGPPPQRFRYDAKKQEMVPIPPPKPEVTLVAPEPLATHLTEFVYFYAPWTEALPQCPANAVLRDFVPFLRILGPYLSRNPTLFQKICRIGKVAIRAAINRSDEDAKVAWLEVTRNILLPALSMTSGNSGLVSEVWVILRQLPYTDRYSLYGEWKYSLYRRPELRVRQAEVEKEAKGILKRISSDNVKLSGRSLAKASHANPTIFFTVALNQVQSYSNLIAPIVECAKYLTHLEYDVFGFNLIDALSNPEKDRTKQDGTSVSQWLQSLAAFTGTLYRRYALMDCSPVLQYIANQLKENNVKDLVIIRELVLKMAGIEPLQNLSDSQVASLTGGRLLRMEAMMMANAGIATPTRLLLRKSGARLLQALTQSRMAMPLLILIAQQRQACIHMVPDTEAHLKYLGNLFDTCQEILFQYVEFLHNQLEPQAYSDLIPSMADLCRRFEIDPAIASHLVRPRLTLRIRAAEAKEAEERLRKDLLAGQAKKEAAAKAESEKDDTTKAEDEEMSDAPGEGKDSDALTSTSNVAAAGSQATEVVMQDGEDSPAQTDADSTHVWSPALAEAYEAAEEALPEQARAVLGVHFYATFWQLGLSDISVPTARYEEEIKALQQMVNDNPEGGRKSNAKTRLHAQDSIRQLRAELKEQTSAHQVTRRRLTIEKDHWFDDAANRVEIVYAMLQHCLIPRALLAPTEAVFAGRFLRLMHTDGTRNFASLTVYDKIIMEQVPSLLFSTTENEARNLARFVQTVLGDLTAWFKDEKRFNDEARGDNLPGFQLKWGDRHGGEAIPDDERLSYEQFKSVVRKWHGMLRMTFIECLSSREYMRIRNSIVVMTRIARFFPMWEHDGHEVVQCVAALSASEERGDLKVLGQGLLATLKKEQKGWIPIPKKKAPASQQPPAKEDADASTEKAKPTEKIAANDSATNGTKDEATTRQQRPNGNDETKENGRSSQASHKLPVRPSGRGRGEERSTSSAAAVSAEAKTNGDGKATSQEVSVEAARRAALNSLRESASTASTASGGSMNPPPRAPQRDRAAAAHPPTGPSSTVTRPALRDGESRSYSDRSRDPSPRVHSSSAATAAATAVARSGAQSGSRNSSRATSEEPGSLPTSATDRRGSDRDGRRDRGGADRVERYAGAGGGSGNNASRSERLPRDQDPRSSSAAVVTSRDGGKDRDRQRREQDYGHDRSGRDRDRATEKERRSGDRRDDGYGATRMQGRGDRWDGDDGRAAASRGVGQQVDTLDVRSRREPQSGGDAPRARETRGDVAVPSSRERDASSSTAAQPDSKAAAASEAPPPQRRSHDVAQSGEPGSPSNSLGKRSLADRLSSALGGGGGGGGSSSAPGTRASSTQAGGAATDGNEAANLSRDSEPNKRPRTSGGGSGDASYEGRRIASLPRSPRAHGEYDDRFAPRGSGGGGREEAQQGISIHGQARSAVPSHPAAHHHGRQPSSQQQPGGGGGGGGYGGGYDRRAPEGPAASSSFRPGSAAGERRSSGRRGERDHRDRDRRRKDRRSGA